ncbi:MAG: aminopeptidase N [Planctomycetota bacterium]|nr:MAG: aminopeptidase N [Planctomycetota bacterium]
MNVQPIRRCDYQPPRFSIATVHMQVDIYADHSVVDTELELIRLAPGDLLLDGEDLDTQLISLDGRSLAAGDYEISEQQLRLPGIGERARLRTVVHLKPQENTQLSGFYQSGNILCTQCEAEGFRRITWFLDRPDVLSRYRVSLSADAQRYPVLLANGNPVAEESLPEGRRRVVWEDPHPKPCYLFAMVAGTLDRVSAPFTTCSGREVICEIYVEPGKAERAHWALESLHHSMRWDEDRYGLEYDLDRYMIVAVSTFNMGAMENKGLNIFNDRYVLADEATATDADFEGVEGVIAHEYFHNWTGNRVTCRDWFQLTLKEGLTVFRDQQFSADRTSQAVKRIDEVRILRGYQFPEDSGPMAHPIRPDSYIAMDNFYTTTVYNKGAEVIRMYHTLLGKAGFRAGMDLYFQRHDGQAVTCDDFLAAMADANQRDFSQFARWYETAGTPRLRAAGSYDPSTKTYTLRISQDIPSNPQAKPLLVPIRLGLLDAQGSSLPLDLGDGQASQERVLELHDAEASWTFHGLSAAPIPSLLRDFSAPVRLEMDCSPDQLAVLASADPDPFNRWQAGQELARQVLLAQIDALVAEGKAPVSHPHLQAAFAATLADTSLDGALRALALGLPTAAELAQERCPVPVEAIHEVRRFHYQDLARNHQAALIACYEAQAVNPADRSVPARQARRLRHTCLMYLSSLGGGHLDRAAQHYAQAGNMTERMAALAALVDHDHPSSAEALADFRRRFAGDDLVMDKWFSLQAIADRADTVERVLELRALPDFRLDNPNRVRSLISALAIANPSHFHRRDGAAYALVGQTVRELAQRNPQLAARLTSCFNQWRRYDRQRQGLMQQELMRIREHQPSKDVLEIVDRALASGEVH